MKTFLLGLALVSSALAMPGKSPRIVGGSDTRIEQYPFMVSMEYDWWGVWWLHTCGGALLTSRSVLSAAHCYYGDDDGAQGWRVRTGSSYPETGGTLHHVWQFIIHDGYHPDHLDHDVAIVHLSKPVTFSESVGSVSIAGPSYIMPDNTVVSAIGWGSIEHQGPSAEVLQHVEVFTVNQALCAERYAYLKTQPGYGLWPDVTDNMKCAGVLGEGGRDACHGDSGGPLLHNNSVVVGVTSWGFECAHHFYPGVYAAVPPHTYWIVENVF